MGRPSSVTVITKEDDAVSATGTFAPSYQLPPATRTTSQQLEKTEAAASSSTVFVKDKELRHHVQATRTPDGPYWYPIVEEWIRYGLPLITVLIVVLV